MVYLLLNELVDIFQEKSFTPEIFVQEKVAEKLEMSIDGPLSKEVW